MILLAVVAAILYAAAQSQKTAPGNAPTLQVSTNAPSFAGIPNLVQKIFDLPATLVSNLGVPAPMAQAPGAVSDTAANQMVKTGELQAEAASGGGVAQIINPPATVLYPGAGFSGGGAAAGQGGGGSSGGGTGVGGGGGGVGGGGRLPFTQ